MKGLARVNIDTQVSVHKTLIFELGVVCASHLEVSFARLVLGDAGDDAGIAKGSLADHEGVVTCLVN